MSIDKALETVPQDRQRLLRTKRDHDQAFDEAIAQARATLCITSGWINDRAMHRRRIAAIREATGRGVHVFIVFGYQSGDDEPTLKPDARRAVSELHSHALDALDGRGGSLVIAHRPVHSKVVVRDNDRAIVGSNNWLSNSAFRNEERSVLIDSTAFASLVRDDVMRMAMDADADTIPRLLGAASG